MEASKPNALLLVLFAACRFCQAQVWTSIGPAPIIGNSGPTGRITAAAVDPSNPNHWLLGTASGGVWDSPDAGTNWTPVTDAQPALAIGSIAFAPGNSNIIYAGTGEADYAPLNYAGQGVLKSVNGGKTWGLLGASTFARTCIGAIRVDPSSPNNVVAIMSRGNVGRTGEQTFSPAPFGVQRSTDGGVTWTQTLAGEASALDVDPTNFNNQYVAISLPSGYGPYNTPVASGLYRSTDGGKTWSPVSGPWSGSKLGRIVLAVAPSDRNTVYASFQGGPDINGSLLGLYRTGDAWDPTPNWTQVLLNGTNYCVSQCNQMPSLSVDPADPTTLFVAGTSLWRCDQCGASPVWTNASANLPANARCIAWSGVLLIACTDRGIFSAVAGTGPWTDNNGTLSVVRMPGGALHPSDPNFALAGAWDNGAALWTGSLPWQSLIAGPGEVALSASNPNTNMMVVNGSRILRSADGGKSFTAADAGFNSTGEAPIPPVRKCPANDDIFLAGASGLWRTANFFSAAAPTWTSNSPANSPSGITVTAIAFTESDPTCNTYAYATATNLSSGRATSSTLSITTDGGATWTNLDPNQTLPSRSVTSLAFDPTTPGTLYATFARVNAASPNQSGHLFKTTNALAATPVWVDISPPVDTPNNVIAVDPANPSSLYVGTDAAVWRSPNGGSGWQFLGPSTGLPNVPVFDLEINPATGSIVAFTFGRGAYSLNPAATPPSGPLVTLSATLPQAMLATPFTQSLAAGGSPPYTWSIAAGALPPGLVLSASGAILGTPLSAGVFSFTILVQDSSGAMASQAVTLSVGTTGAAPVWTNIGPSPSAYVQDPAYIPNFNSGRVASIAVDPSDSTHWLVGVGNGGVWESHDAGTSWRPISDSAPTLTIGAVAFAPSDSQTIYAATGEATGPGMTKAGLGMLKSTDGGVTWSLLAASTFARAAVRRVRVSPTDPNTVLATVSRGGFGRDSHEGVPGSPPFGIVKSTDGGVTWTRTLAGFATGLEIDPTNFNRQYAAIGETRNPNGINNDSIGSVVNGLYRSTDGGNTWSPIPGPWGISTPAVASIGRTEIAIAPSNPNVLYASFAMPTNGGDIGLLGLLGLYRTDNAWDPAPQWIEVNTAGVGEDGYCGPDKCDYSHVISVDPADPDTLFAGGAEDGFWRCTSCGGAPAWNNVTLNSSVHSDKHALTWAANRLILGCDGGVWSTPDLGNSWQDHNATLSTLMFFSGSLHPTNPNFILGGLRDFQITVRTGANTWSILPEIGTTEWGEAEVALSSSHPDTDWMAAWIWGVISRTTDGGQSRIDAYTGIDVTSSAFVAPVRKCPFNDDMFLTGTNRMWRTDNFFSGATPTWVPNGPPSSFPNQGTSPPGTIQAIAFSESDTTCQTYAYGNYAGQVQLTRDGGQTWTNLDPGATLPARPVNWLAFDPTNPNVAYAAISSFDDATPATPGHVFKSTNAMSASSSWTNVSPPLNQPFDVIALDPANPLVVYAGSDIGLWRSTDGAATWTAQGPSVGMPIAPIYDIKINPATGRTVAFTYGRSAFALGPEILSVMSSPDNGATYIPGPLIPGAFGEIQGRNLGGGQAFGDPDNPPLILNGVQVTVNGIPASIYYATPNQLNFQIPSGINGPLSVQVLRDNVPSNLLAAVAN